MIPTLGSMEHPYSVEEEEQLEDEEEEESVSATGRKPDIKICQTDTLVLVSILEPGLSECDVNVLIEPKTISVEITRDDIINPVVAGVLFAEVHKNHCRVRIKPDSVLIKLRKTEKGRWRSILEEVLNDVKTVTPETRIRPRRGVDKESREPIEPMTHEKPTTVAGGTKRITKKPQPLGSYASNDTSDGDDDVDAEETAINPSESKVMGALESMKKFHQALFNPTSFFGQPTMDEDEESRNDTEAIQGPLIRNRRKQRKQRSEP
ncbi:Suppressor of g2 allele of skp1 [Seminavis robusta]|uniref:Suppressor of g2 allele of skp1 n=1 Tax=Seminavis robusta TaxID=568900 RepID=A0A9N8DA62_9STRA|nr:Suppressor of g2 allele of skp1 [Seminavis robusta]|eukprot:Sro13_g010090.1 Suppressor of g2 allele of skp1 (264) ;mRNA; r:118524-119315